MIDIIFWKLKLNLLARRNIVDNTYVVVDVVKFVIFIKPNQVGINMRITGLVVYNPFP